MNNASFGLQAHSKQLMIYLKCVHEICIVQWCIKRHCEGVIVHNITVIIIKKTKAPRVCLVSFCTLISILFMFQSWINTLYTSLNIIKLCKYFSVARWDQHLLTLVLLDYSPLLSRCIIICQHSGRFLLGLYSSISLLGVCIGMHKTVIKQ